VSGQASIQRAGRPFSWLAQQLLAAVGLLASAVVALFRRKTWTSEGARALLALAAKDKARTALAGSLLLGAALLFPLALAPQVPPGIALAEVREGPFEVTIVESGVLQALKSVTYASQIQSNQAKIIAIVPEGKMVQKGDLLILFDQAPFEEEIRRSQAALAQAQAELRKAQEDSKLQAIQNQEEIGAGRQKLERSELELKDAQEGKGQLKEQEAVAAVAAAERELQKTKTALEDLKPLLSEGFITRQELERAEQAMAKAAEELELANRRRDSLLRFTRPLELAQAKSEAALSRESLKQLETSAAYRLEQKRAVIAGAESRIQEASSKLALAQQQLARTEVRADVPGIVVYRDVFFGSEQRKPQVGDQVWANQPLLILPDISKMVVETKIRETDIHKVEKNQKVKIRVQAYPEMALGGKVTLVGSLAQEERERRGSKFFGVTILVNESDQRLRPGMTAAVEIQVEERARATFVPLDAVFEREGQDVCYVHERRGFEARPVVLGPSNQDFVVVEKGLRRAERVALRDPSAPAAEPGSPPVSQ
jgi:HlyD family secretion protein